jgi:hypothetical protein
MGDFRFTLGVMQQMLLKKGYTCSVATYGHLMDPDETKPEPEQRRDVKQAITNHYNENYAKQADDIAEPDKALDELVGTKRPMDRWEHKSYERLYSFYAGKVHLNK